MSLVLWFKGNSVERHSVPIYTVDARLKPLNNGARHFIADAYKGRAKFITKSWPPYLDLWPLEEEDQSEYRCRIDYRSKPRENFLIILFVLGEFLALYMNKHERLLFNLIYLNSLSKDSSYHC